LFAQCERATAVNDYLTNYVANDFNVFELNWSGSQYSCNTGTYNQAINNKILARINYFRRITGLNDNVTFDGYLNQICQQAAVMLEVNESLNHCNGTNNYPCNTWPCSTTSYFDPVTLYIEDPGSNNQPVGHRRWLLYPRAQTFGNGVTNSKNVIYVSDNFFNQAQNSKPYVAYPPEGYVPAPIVFERWSFSMENADFSNAYVTMTGPNGFAVQLNIIYYNGLYGDPAIVWVPQNIQLNNNDDVTYTVAIGGIQNTSQSVYTYQTTIVQPTHPPKCPNNMEWSNSYCECRQIITNNCLDHINLNAPTIFTGLYSANKKVISSGAIHNQATVWFYAEDRITLTSNFKVKKGARFKAQINSCGY